MNDPDISVLMTVFNGELYLREAIDSVLAQQTAHGFELVIVDDGSTDASGAILDDAAQRDPRIRVVRHPNGENRGISASRNLALDHARGDFIAFLDADDVWLPYHLELHMQVFADHPEIAMVYGSAERWHDHAAPFDRAKAEAAQWGENYIPPIVPPGQAAGRLPKKALLRWYLDDQSMVPCICSVIVRAQVMRDVGGFVSAFKALYDDQVFHAKISRGYPIYANPVCTARYRQHDQSCCAVADAGDRAPIEAEAEAVHRWLTADDDEFADLPNLAMTHGPRMTEGRS